MGSKSDLPVMQECLDLLEKLNIPYQSHVMSAHRTPDKVRDFASSARENGFECVIAAAGGAGALPGAVKAYSALPVIGVPIPSSELKGVDSLYSMAQMPPGAPVATVAIGSWGARNAALLAAEILSIRHEDIRSAYDDYRTQLRSG
jgi:5-(carboxyamino)imidazole ribonucleotide mutase